MLGLFGIVFFAALICSVIGMVMVVVNKLKKKSLKKSLKFVGVSFLAAFVGMIGLGIVAPDEPVTIQGNGNATVSAEKSPTTTKEPTVAPIEKTEKEVESFSKTETPNPTPEASTEEPSTTPSPSPTLTPSPTPKYSGEKLDSLLTNYISSQKKSDKDKLMQANPEELYSKIASRLKGNYAAADVNIVQNKSFYKLCGTLGELYLELDNNSPNADEMRKIIDVARIVLDNNKEIETVNKKYSYKLKEAFETFNSGFIVRDFYITQKLETKYEDTFMGKLQKELSALEEKPTLYVAADVESTTFGDMPGSTYYVVRPIKAFSESGVYSLGVIPDGTMKLVDDKGFEKDATVYLELDDNYIIELNGDYEIYISTEAYNLELEDEIKTLLSIKTN